MATATNPTISKAARKRAHERIQDYQKRVVAAGERYQRGVTLGDGSERDAHQDVVAMMNQEEGYITALNDLLPTRVVEAIIGDGEDADSDGEDADSDGEGDTNDGGPSEKPAS